MVIIVYCIPHISTFCRSVVYKLDSTQHLSIHQQLPTAGAVHLAMFPIDGDTYLAIAQNRADVETAESVTVYVWNAVTRLFVRVQEIPMHDARRVSSFRRLENDRGECRKVHL